MVEFAGDSTFVYILTDSTSNEQQFKKISIITGNSDGIKIEVKEGIDSLVRLRGDLIKNN